MNDHKVMDTKRIHLLVIGRYIPLSAITLIYLFAYDEGFTWIKMGIAAGIIVISIICSHIYIMECRYTISLSMIVAVCFEIAVCGLIIVFYGGFSCPYLWYFISSLTLAVSAERRNKRFIILTLSSFFCITICALIGMYSKIPISQFGPFGLNATVAIFVVGCGLYTLHFQIGEPDKHKQYLINLNESLAGKAIDIEKILRHAMDVYTSLNLLSITDPGKFIDEITSFAYETIAPDGCMLLKLDSLQEIDHVGSCGLSEIQEAHLAERIAKLDFMAPRASLPHHIETQDAEYSITYISSMSSILGVLITPFNTDTTQAKHNFAQDSLYMNLFKIIIQELDMQSIVNSYISSEEQNRIVNEIHDTVIQKLFSISSSLNMIAGEKNESSYSNSMEEVKNIAKAVDSSMRSLREAIYGHRWETDMQDIFIDKLKHYLDELTSLSGVDIRLSVDCEFGLTTAIQKSALYRIICEAVNNAIFHGQATEVNVNIKVNNSNMVIRIIDNGRGFDESQIRADGRGVKNMYNMANLLKGQLSIESQIGKGTVIECILPI